MTGADVWKSCSSCGDYMQHRRGVIAQPLADKAQREGRAVIDVVDEFMRGAHARHMAGHPLRTDGPTRATDPAIGRLAALLSPGLFSAPEATS